MTLISFVVPFYHGNQYINGLVSCVSDINKRLVAKTGDSVELIIINDSPDEAVSYNKSSDIDVRIYNNVKNLGIQASRINGLRQAKGKWINFLDQDDLLITENYLSYLDYMDKADVIISNGYYERHGKRQQIFKNQKVQNYYIQERQLINIRNLIPSPGESLIRKDVIPCEWQKNVLSNNGADDWFLWLLLYSNGAKYVANPNDIYIHRTTDQGNLSFDYEKMYKSCQNMLSLLKNNVGFSSKKWNRLDRAIEFKYLKDTDRITLLDYLKFFDCFVNNIAYKVNTLLG